jgi:hypothetical protein
MEPEASTPTPKVRAHISSGGFIQIARGISAGTRPDICSQVGAEPLYT